MDSSGSATAASAMGEEQHAESRAERAVVWAIGGVMLLVAAAPVAWAGGPPAAALGRFTNIAFLAAAAGAFTIAVRRGRGRTELSDAFFWLVLLNPIVYGRHAEPYNPTLMGAGLLGLMAGGIIAMKQNNTLRYMVVLVLALVLGWISTSFFILLPPLVVWLLAAGWTMARSPAARERVRGFVVMACGEAGIMAFGLACLLAEPTKSPPGHELFATVVNFMEFPLLVVAIVTLALGWRSGPEGKTPPHFAGVLALLVGLLAMLLNNFQLEALPPPGTDQTVLVLCLVYTVFALHGPRRLHWAAPSVLLVLAGLYAVFR